MEEQKCFCHFNGYEVKDAKARNDIANLYVNNIEELKSSTLNPGDVVKTLGYYKANDGGSGLYLIRDLTSDDVEDNGSIHFIGTSLVAELISDSECNVKQFGAKNDAEFDSTIYIQNAINYAIAHKIKLIINEEYNITSTLNISNSLNIKGFNGKINKIGDNFINEFIYINANVNKCVIESLTINGNNKAKIGIRLNNNKNVLIKDCEIYSMSDETTGGFGIYTYYNDDLIIEDCTIHDILGLDNGNMSGDGIAINMSTNVLVNKNQISECGRHNISVYGLGHDEFQSQNNINITNNLLTNTYLSGIDIESGENVNICFNHFENNGDSSLTSNGLASAIALMEDSTGSIVSSKVKIIGNTTKNSTHSAIYSVNNCNNVIITDNNFEGAINGIHLYKGSGSYDLNVNNNHFKDFTNVFNFYHSNANQHLNITNNRIYDSTSVFGDGSQFANSNFSDNIIYNCVNLFKNIIYLVYSTFKNNNISVSKFSNAHLFIRKFNFIGNILKVSTTTPALIYMSHEQNDDHLIITDNQVIGDITYIITDGTNTNENINNSTYNVKYDNNLLIAETSA